MASSNYSASQKSSEAPTLPKFDFERPHAQHEAGHNGKKRTRGGKRARKDKLKAAQRAYTEEIARELNAPRGPGSKRTQGQAVIQADHARKQPAERPTDDEFSSDNEFEDAQSTFGDTDGKEAADSALDGVTEMLAAASLEEQTTASSLQSASRTKSVRSKHHRKDPPKRKGASQAAGMSKLDRRAGCQSEATEPRRTSIDPEVGCPVRIAALQYPDDKGWERNALRITADGHVQAHTPNWYAPPGAKPFNWDKITELTLSVRDDTKTLMTIPYSLSPSLPLTRSTSTASTNAPSATAAPASAKGSSRHNTRR